MAPKVKRVCVLCGRPILRRHKYTRGPEGLKHRLCDAPSGYVRPRVTLAEALQ